MIKVVFHISFHLHEKFNLAPAGFEPAWTVAGISHRLPFRYQRLQFRHGAIYYSNSNVLPHLKHFGNLLGGADV
jgi:hypothetical protein